jgi:hypothetical protein|tara:strand:+ start:1281 stop:1778 length:498 start_codon:yes stop_codon:yes gene_type:complete
MATILDIASLEFLIPLFHFIFISVILYAILQKTKLLGGKSGSDILVSIMLTILVMFTSSALDLAIFMSVWSVVILVILIFLVLLFSFWSKEENFGMPLNIKSLVFWIFIIILIVGLTKVFGPIFTPYSGDDGNLTVLKTLFHPRVIGALVFLIIISNIVKIFKSN